MSRTYEPPAQESSPPPDAAGRDAVPPRGLLGTSHQQPFHPPVDGVDWRAINWLRLWSTRKRTRHCGTHKIGDPYLEVTAQGTRTRKVAFCGSWLCPRCGGRYARAWAAVISVLLYAAASAGYRVVFITLTVPHGPEDALSPLMDRLAGAWDSFTTGRKPWAGHKPIGYVRCWDVTWGPTTGWHPHFHVLAVLPAGDAVDTWTGPELEVAAAEATLERIKRDIADMQSVLDDTGTNRETMWMRGRRASLWQNEGRLLGEPALSNPFQERRHAWSERWASLTGSVARMQDVRAVELGDTTSPHRCAHYLVRASLELAAPRIRRKQGRRGRFSPGELLAEAARGSAECAERWRELEGAFKGRRRVTGAAALKRRLKRAVIRIPDAKELLCKPRATGPVHIHPALDSPFQLGPCLGGAGVWHRLCQRGGHIAVAQAADAAETVDELCEVAIALHAVADGFPLRLPAWAAARWAKLDPDRRPRKIVWGEVDARWRRERERWAAELPEPANPQHWSDT